MPSQKLLIVSQHFWPENFRINDIVQGLLEQSISVDVLCGLPNYPKGDWFDSYRYWGPRSQKYFGANVIRSGEIPRKGNRSFTIFLNYVSWPFFALFHLFRLKGPYDAVLCYNTSPVLMCVPAIVYGKLHRVPVVNYVLDLWPENLYSVLPVQNKFLQKIALTTSNFLYKHCDYLIAMSDGMRSVLLKRTGKAPERVSVIPQYCEDFYAANIEAPSPFHPNCFTLMFAGNFSPAQGLDTVIRAVVKAHERYSQIRLELVGDGMSRAELEQLVNQLNAQSYIHFYGSVAATEIPALSAKADALIVSLAKSDNLGLTVPAKIASCMAAAKPIIGSIDDEGANTLLAAKCGPVCDAGNVDNLADAIAELSRLPDEDRKQLGINAKEYYRQNFQRDKLLCKLKTFIFKNQ